MRAVLFVEIKGVKYFKCDTFWSKSENPRNAKIYSNDRMSELKDWLQSIFPYNIYENMFEAVYEKYNNAKLGYFTPDESLYENSFILKEGTKVEDLGDPKYLWVIKMNPISEWKLEYRNEKEGERRSANVMEDSLGTFLDYTEEHRDEVISDILKEKESE